MPYAVKYNPQRPFSKRADRLRKEIERKVRTFYRASYAKRRIEPGRDLIETAGKYIGEEELIHGVSAVLDGWWTEGRFAALFSRMLSSYIGTRYCVLVNSGSSANLIALAALTSPLLGKRRLTDGDEVITVAAAFPTTVNPIVQLHCTPVFLDIDLETLNVDTTALERALSPKTRAIMIAHTQGNPFSLDAVLSFAKRHELWVIEDCCDALGAEYDGKKVGSFGDVSTVSFYAAHQITAGEGGALLTNNPWLYRAAKSFRDWGRDCWCEPGEDNACRRRFAMKFKNLPYGYDHKFVYSHVGYNLKMTDLQAAIGVAQLKRISRFVTARRKNYDLLREGLSRFEKYFQFQQPQPKSNPSWFGFMVTLKPGCPFELRDIVHYLNDHKVATRPLYCGNITRHPYFENLRYRIIDTLKNTDYATEHTFWVGVHPNLTIAQIRYMVDVITKFIDEKS